MPCPYCGRWMLPTMMAGPEGRKEPDRYLCPGCPVLWAGVPELLAQRRAIAAARV